MPSLSILAEPSVAVVDKMSTRRARARSPRNTSGTCTPTKARRSRARNFYRPTSDKARAKFDKQFPKLTLVSIDQSFGGWGKAAKDHFADGASFDQIYTAKQK